VLANLNRPSSSAGGARGRATVYYQAFNWQHGVFRRRCMGSETDGGRPPARWALCGATRWRCLPFLLLQTCRLLSHWLTMGAQNRARPPAVSSTVNWFRRRDGTSCGRGFGRELYAY